VIVRYEPGVSAAQRAEVREDVDATSARSLGLARTELLRLPGGVPVAEAVRDLEGRGDVEFVQPDYLYAPEGVPNDSLFNVQWGLNNTGQAVNGHPAGTPDADIDAPEAWDVTTGAASVIVGVVDTGFNTVHPDLSPNIFVNAAEAGGAPNVDDDGNGRKDDVTGFDFVNDDGVVSDDVERHGSLVASVIGAKGGNGFGVSGVAQSVRVLPLQAVTPLGGISSAAAVAAVSYAQSMGARIVNMSFGDYAAAPNPALTAAMDAAPNILFTTSAGNETKDNDAEAHWPSNLSATRGNVVATANTTNVDALAGSSSFGATTVDFAAPGNDIAGVTVGTDAGTRYSENFDGALSGWDLGGTWAVTPERFVSGPNSLADSPGGANYTNNSDTTATSASFVLPTDMTFCDILHQRRRRLEVNGDFYSVEVLRNGAEPGIPIEKLDADTAGDFASGSPGFGRQGATSARIRFRLKSNGSVVADGVHVDNVDVRCGPTTAAVYRFAGGTSFASPVTAGVAALMLSANSSLSPSTLKSTLRSTSDAVPALAGKVVANGRLNANAAVRAVAPPPPPPPPPPPIADIRSPLLSSFSLAPATFRAFRAGTSVRAAATVFGTLMRFRVDEPSRARLQVHRRLPGRRVGRLCLVATRARVRARRPRCTRYLLKGAYSMPGQLTGLVRRRFTGRIAGRALAPGLYRLMAVATDLSGNRSLPVRRNFRIVAR
jgi:subtilisin family serine protease